MLKLIVRMKVLPEKLKELTQTVATLVKSIRIAKGCKSCDYFCSIEDENELCLFEEWENHEVLDKHLQSEHFKVLLGATNLLEAPHEVKVYHGIRPRADASALPTDDLPGCLIIQN
jgi:quinol monooxygenase YgiN